jgi:hypothetical protein
MEPTTSILLLRSRPNPDAPVNVTLSARCVYETHAAVRRPGHPASGTEAARPDRWLGSHMPRYLWYDEATWTCENMGPARSDRRSARGESAASLETMA